MRYSIVPADGAYADVDAVRVPPGRMVNEGGQRAQRKLTAASEGN